MMNYQQDNHPDADPFMKYFSRYLVSHQKQQQDRHGGINGQSDQLYCLLILH